MHILIVHNTSIPVKTYGGIERIVWWLGKGLHKLGHKITFLVAEGSSCNFAKCLVYDKTKPVNEQIPDDVDFVHLHFQIQEKLKKPYLISNHTNYHPLEKFDINTVFSSRNHAERNSSNVYVYNGIDISEYDKVDFNRKRKYLLFMAYAKRPEKNLKDCKFIARKTKNTLAVIGLKNKWFRRFQYRVKCFGFLGGKKRDDVIQLSKAFLFPVLWHEPFGIAMLECLYYGCPVIGTKYGSLPELINPEVGFLSNSKFEMINAVNNIEKFSPNKCHEFVCDKFNSNIMVHNYLQLYDKVLSGKTLNEKEPINGGNFSRDELLPVHP